MKDRENIPIWSGKEVETVEKDVAKLVDFRDEGMPLDELSALIEKYLEPHLIRYGHPGFHSLFNCFPEEGAHFGAKIALEYNQGVTNYQVSPGGVMTEVLCCRALCRLFGLGPEADATVMYCGTYANQQALYLALHRKAEQHGFNLSEKGLAGFPEPENLVVLASREAHFSLKHAVRIMGLGENSVVPLPVDKDLRLDIPRMRQAVKDLSGVKEVFCIVMTTGTTATGSVDPVQPVIDLCGQGDIWLHVDGAYGFAYRLVPEYSRLFDGTEFADSITWDPHKQFGVPIPSSVLFVRNKDDLYRMALYGDYFNRKEETAPNPGLKSPPSTRPFTALPIVTTIRYNGISGIINKLRAPLEAIKELADKLRHEPDIECRHTPDLGILCFQVVPEGFPRERLDRLQQYLFDRTQNEGKRSVSMTKLDGKTVLRILVLSPEASADELFITIDYLRALARDFSL
ncbi:pyridoxal phosphate-dependent decarboxylase family protein [candidate division KSB1 bacterium]